MCSRRALRLTCAIVAACWLTTSHFQGQGQGLTEDDLRDAIKLGERYGTPQDFLEIGLAKYYRLKMKTSHAPYDGISRHMTVLTPWASVASAAADGYHRRNRLKMADAQRIAAAGITNLVLEIHANAAIPSSLVDRLYGDKRAHVVLSYKGIEEVQPVEFSTTSDRESSGLSGVMTFNVFGSFGLGVGIPIGWVNRTLVMTFGFKLTPAQRSRTAEAVLIDADGESPFDARINFSEFR